MESCPPKSSIFILTILVNGKKKHCLTEQKKKNQQYKKTMVHKKLYFIQAKFKEFTSNEYNRASQSTNYFERTATGTGLQAVKGIEIT